LSFKPEIVKLAESLGAKTDAKNKLHDSMLDATVFAREYAASFQWPESKTYYLTGSGEKLYGAPVGSELDLTNISLHGIVTKVDDEFFDGKCVYPIGKILCGSYMLFFHGEDKTPQNPMIYHIDHELNSNSEACELFRFHEFLSRLELN